MAPSFVKSLKSALGSSKSKDEARSSQGGAPPSSLQAGQQNDSSLACQDASSANEAQLHQDAHEDGGLSCNNEELLREQRDAITEWIKSMGKRLFTGSFNLISTPFPVIMFEPRSYLEKLADVWVYPRYLSEASECRDPLERMKLVVTWFVAGLHHGFEKWKKPFNPILGETWQATLSDGSEMFMEQISHHPPVSAFHLEGPGGKYRFRGLSQPNVALMVKHYGFKTVAKGFRYVEFADGSRIDITYPGYYIKGVVYSARPRAEVDGSAVFEDKAHRLKAVLRFGANKGARAPVMRRSDAITGEIYDVSGQAQDGSRTHLGAEPELESRSSTDGAEARGGGGGGDAVGDDKSDGWETASETDWDLRDLREAAEEAQAQGGADSGSPHVAMPPPARPKSALAGAGSSSGRVVSASVPVLVPFSSAPAPGALVPPAGPSASGAAPVLVASRCSLPAVPYAAASTFSTPHGGAAGPLPRTSSDGTAAASGLRRVSEPGGQQGSAGSSSKDLMKQRSEQSYALFGGWGISKMMGLGGSSGPNQGAVEEEAACVLARLEGSWLSHLNVDGKRYWTLTTERPDQWRPATRSVLPSDSRYRHDLAVLKEGDVKGSQAWKEQLENLQRRDKKLRDAATGKAH